MTDDGSHECPKTGCDKRVAYEMLACSAHWYSVPKPLRAAVWRTYKDNGPGSPEHTAAICAAIRAMNRAA
jgi:hypothetical protein